MASVSIRTSSPTRGAVLSFLVSLLFVSLLCAGDLGAQSRSDNLAVGSTVRVVLPDSSERALEGTLLTLQADYLTLAAAEVGRRDLRWADIDSLFIQRRTSNAARGAGTGFLGGAAISGLLFFATYEECDEDEPFACAFHPPRGGLTLAGALVGGLVGMVAGLIVGASQTSERWEHIDLGAGPRPAAASGDSRQLSVAPTFRLTIPLGR